MAKASKSRSADGRREHRPLGLGMGFGLAAILLALSCAAAALWGVESITLSRALFVPGSLDRTILVDVRLPRIALAVLSGAGLAAVGTAFQALLRNPLAEPYVLGVSGGAAFGATSAIAAGISATGLLGALFVPAAAFAGGLLATLLVYWIAQKRDELSGASILLAGVMVNAIASALITFLKTLVTPSRAQQLLRWLTGFIDLPSGVGLLVVALYVGAGCAVLLYDAGRLNVLSLGEEAAESLGVSVRSLTGRVFFASSCVVGAIVSLTGLIGFVGLFVPHVLRRLFGPDHRVLLPMSLMMGGTALVICDLCARLFFRPLGTEPPVGAVTALIGGPAFLWLLRKSAR